MKTGPIPTDVAWLAGIVEGEGCLSLSHGTTPRINVGMTDRDVIEKIAALWESKVYVCKRTGMEARHKTMYKTGINGDRAISWIVLLRPFMGERRGRKMDEIFQARLNSVMRLKRSDGMCPKCQKRARSGSKAYCEECYLAYFRKYNESRRGPTRRCAVSAGPVLPFEPA